MAITCMGARIGTSLASCDSTTAPVPGVCLLSRHVAVGLMSAPMPKETPMQRSPARSILTALAWFVIGGLLTACQSGSGRTQGGAPQLSAADELTLPASQEPTDTATGSVTFIGNATVLIRYAGLTILTDPTFIHKHEQVSIGYGLHTTRLTDPAMDIRDLPPLDFILRHTSTAIISIKSPSGT
jgi:hypothetical protein